MMLSRIAVFAALFVLVNGGKTLSLAQDNDLRQALQQRYHNPVWGPAAPSAAAQAMDTCIWTLDHDRPTSPDAAMWACMWSHRLRFCVDCRIYGIEGGRTCGAEVSDVHRSECWTFVRTYPPRWQ